MTDILIRNARTIVTMDDAGSEPEGADILIRDGVIAGIGTGLQAPEAEVIDAAACVVTPGLVNTHHHLYQTLTRAVPGGAGRAALRLAEDALSDLGALRAGGDACLRADRPGGTGAVGLHADLGSSLPLPERRAARGHDRGGAARSACGSIRPAAR